MNKEHDWSYVVVRCRVENRGDILWKISDFLQQTKGIQSFHFRFGGMQKEKEATMLYVCFRILVKINDKKTIESSIASKLRELAEIGNENFKINPKKNDAPFNTYVKFTPYPPEAVNKWGGKKNWEEYMLVLARLSRIVADLAKKGLFNSGRRSEVLHLFCNMLQMHETGAVHVLGGYQDFINPNETYYIGSV